MLGKGIQEAIEIHNSRLGQMRRAVSPTALFFLPTGSSGSISSGRISLNPFLPRQLAQMQQNEDTIKQQQNEIEDLKRKLRLKDEAEAKVRPPPDTTHHARIKRPRARARDC
jgi:hypothetical protein